MLSQNEFESRPEVIFIEYDKVIKNSDQFLLFKLANELDSIYKNILHIEPFKGLNIHNMLPIVMGHKFNNIFEALKKIELEDGWYKSYLDLYNYYPEMFEECELLEMGRALHIISNQKFTERIVVWSPYEDKRIAEDLVDRHSNLSKLEYMFGDPLQIFEASEHKFTSFIISNVDLLDPILNYSKVDYSEIMLADYRFNKFEENGEMKSLVGEETFSDKIIKFGMFNPARLEAYHVENLVRDMK